jgi:hypothetical protein
VTARLVDQQMESRMAQMSLERKAAPSADRKCSEVRARDITDSGWGCFWPAQGGRRADRIVAASSAGEIKQVPMHLFYAGAHYWGDAAIVVMGLKPPEDFILKNPLAFNVGRFGSHVDSVPLRAGPPRWTCSVVENLRSRKGGCGKKLSMGRFCGGIPWAVVT